MSSIGSPGGSLGIMGPPITPPPHGNVSEPGIITEYTIDTYYDWDYGLVKVPMAAPDGMAARIVKTHAQTGRKTVVWTTERDMGRPVCPHWDTGNPNEVLVFKRIIPANALFNVDGRPIWRITGMYIYELLLPLDLDKGDSMVAGYMPYDPWSTQMYWDGNLFDKRFLSAAAARASGGDISQVAIERTPPANPTLP